jgi:hypothetical protein
MREDALNLVLEKHTYKKRWEQILDSIEAPYAHESTNITCIFYAEKGFNFTRIYEAYSKLKMQINTNRLLIILSKNLSDEEISTYYISYNKFEVGILSESYFEKYSINKEYSPIETNYFLFLDCLEIDLIGQFVSKAILHSQYAENSLIGKSESSKYTYLDHENYSGPIFGTASAFHDLKIAMSVKNSSRILLI